MPFVLLLSIWWFKTNRSCLGEILPKILAQSQMKQPEWKNQVLMYSSLKRRKELENELGQALEWMVQALSVCWGEQWACSRDMGSATLSSRYWAVSLLAVTKGKLQQEKQLAALIAFLSTSDFEPAWGWRGIFPLPQCHIAELSQGLCCPTGCSLSPTGHHCQSLCPITSWFIFLLVLYGWSELWKSKDRAGCQMGSSYTFLYPGMLAMVWT